MKVLIAAIACHPTAGSEAYVGWQAISALRRDHELCVLTSLWCREGIEKAVNEEEGWEKVRFLYVDQARGRIRNHPNRLIARLQSWTHYRRWCSDAKKVVRQLINQERFDLGHHVTYATWRMGSPLAGLGIPWIWGPIGGGEKYPLRLIGQLSPISILFEISRAISTVIGVGARAPRAAARSATIVLPNNPETERLVRRLGSLPPRIAVLAQSFLPPEGMARFAAPGKIAPNTHGRLEIVAGGNLEGRKGVAIAIKSLALVKAGGIPFRFRYFGHGPESAYLCRQVETLGLRDEVFFCESLRGEEYAAMLKGSHVYLLPSLREGVPVTQLEAMASGCVPIVAACGGASTMALDAGIEPIPVGSSEGMAGDISDRLAQLWNNPILWNDQSRCSENAIREKYSAHHYRSEMNGFYAITAARLSVCKMKS